MEKLENQNDHYIMFNFHDGYYSLSIVTNYALVAIDTKEGISKAGKLESKLCKFIKVEFNLPCNDFIVDVRKNEYFDKVVIHEYLVYDPEKGEDATLTKEQFVALLKEDYKEYLEKNRRLTFESNAYGVVPKTEVQAVNEVS